MNQNIDSITLVYVCHIDDLSILYLSLRCLDKNWRGHKKLLIINEDGNTLLPGVVQDSLGAEWDVEIADAPEMSTNEVGWYRQQICKLYAGNIVTTDWQIILDCKNLMIKETYPSDFITATNILLVGSMEPDITEWDIKILNESRKIVNGIDIGIYPRCLTPWVFNTALTRSLWNKLRPDKVTNWVGSEFYIYWYYSNCKFKYNVQFPITGTCGGLILSISHDVPERIMFWNLHRFGTAAPEILSASLTYLLIKHIIAADEVTHFYTLLSRTNPTISQIPGE